MLADHTDLGDMIAVPGITAMEMKDDLKTNLPLVPLKKW